jgi:hypothetical protein
MLRSAKFAGFHVMESLAAATLNWCRFNLTNKHAYLEDVAQLGLPNAAYNRVATNQPRTIGVDITYRH